MKEERDEKRQKVPHATVFHELLHGDLPEEEKGVERLSLEGQLLIAAATETTAWSISLSYYTPSSQLRLMPTTALSVTMFYLLSYPAKLSILIDELTVAIPDASQLPSWSTLERLPYLISHLANPVHILALNIHQLIVIDTPL